MDELTLPQETSMGRQLKYVNIKKGVNITLRLYYQVALSLFRKAELPPLVH